jgi:DNA-binding NarL/FixJ family response regulator
MTTTLLRSPSDVDRRLSGAHRADLLSYLSPREVEVLALMAEGLSNRAIGAELRVELKTVEAHVGSVFTKLGLYENPRENRRVRAVLAFLGLESA